MVRYHEREPVRTNRNYPRREYSPVRRRSPVRRGRSPPSRRFPERDERRYDNRVDRRRDVPIGRKPARIDPRKYLPPVRNPAKYIDAPHRNSPTSSSRKRAASRSPIRNGHPKRDRVEAPAPKKDDEIALLERGIRFQLTDIFTLCIHSDKPTHKERLQLVEEKVKEIRNIIDELPKDKPENLELEEVDCDVASGDEKEPEDISETEEDTKEGIFDSIDDETANIVLDRAASPESEEDTKSPLRGAKTPPDESDGEDTNEPDD